MTVCSHILKSMHEDFHFDDSVTGGRCKSATHLIALVSRAMPVLSYHSFFFFALSDRMALVISFCVFFPRAISSRV